MIELIKAAIGMGWPALGILVGLMFYFKASISDPVANKRAVFKTFIGTIGAFLLFMAIANYKMNFFAESRLLPVSLVLITSMTFMMALYFTNISALLKIGGFMFFIAAALSGYGNWLPQVEGGFPPIEEKKDFSNMPQTELADEGEKIIFGGVGQNKVQGAIGKGQCPLCQHVFEVPGPAPEASQQVPSGRLFHFQCLRCGSVLEHRRRVAAALLDRPGKVRLGLSLSTNT